MFEGVDLNTNRGRSNISALNGTGSMIVNNIPIKTNSDPYLRNVRDVSNFASLDSNSIASTNISPNNDEKKQIDYKPLTVSHVETNRNIRYKWIMRKR